MDYLSPIANIVGILGTIFALAAWRKARQVQYQLERDQLQLQRAALTRAEVMGILGMLPMKERDTRFSIDAVSTRDFLDRINDIVTSDGDKRLIIHCQQSELDQFDFDAFQRKML